MASTTATPHQSVTILKPDEGKTFWVLTDRVRALLGPAETGGSFCLSEVSASPGGGPPPHRHTREDELFIVLEGEFQFLLGDKTYRGTAGSCVYLPKDVVHTYKNVGNTPGRFLAFATPCGFERFFATVATPTPPAETGLDPTVIQRLLATAPNYGIDMNPALSGPPTDAGPCPDGDPRWVMGLLVDMKLKSAQTNGHFTVADIQIWPGAEGAPIHSHRTVDEMFYVVEGQVEFDIDGRRETYGAGSMVFLPRGAVHAFRNGSADKPARVFDVHTPGGFEAFFEEIGSPVTDRTARPAPPSGPPDMVFLRDLLDRHGMDMPDGGPTA